ncbi:poliovirus receptor-related protein 3 [Microdochium nivale]|nr:poliovirus receptor-related protein 3 [Microdochium nivale]
MRLVSAFLLLSSASGVRAALLHNWADSESPTWMPTETGAVKSTSSTTGWTPKPTRAPGFVSEQDQVVGLLRRQRQLTDTTAWVNDRTCGWVAQTPSRAILCGSDFTCATNNANLVACVSGTFSPFFRVCMDYSAVQQGQCSDVGPETGCCDNRASPACATWIWTGQPARSQYGCAARSTIYSVMDVPQFVLDSLTRSTTSSTRPSSTLSTKATSTAGQSSPSQSIQTSLLPSTGSTTGNTTGDNLTIGNQTSTTTNLAPIIGGAAGGLAGLILLVLLVFFCMRRRRNKKASTVNKSSTESNTENNTTVNYNMSQENQYTNATTSNTSFNHDKAVANALIHEKDVDIGNASGGASNGGGDSGKGALAVIFCCGAGTRKSKKDKNSEKALQPSRDNTSVHAGMSQSQQQHAAEEHHHHHHYHFDPNMNNNTNSRAPSSITARDSDVGSGFIGPGQQPPAQTFSFDVMPQPSHGHHPASLTPYNPYAAGSTGVNLTKPPVMPVMPAMPGHYSHSSPLGISNNSPVPTISELKATPMAGSTAGQYHQQSQQPQPCQQQQYHHHHHEQPQQYLQHQQQYPLVSYSHHGAHHQGAQKPALYAAQHPSAPPPIITAINTNASHASASSSPAPSSSRMVSPSPLSSTASSMPSLHQLQLQTGGGDTVLHALHPPPAQATRASMHGSFHHVGGGVNGQTREQGGQDQQRQHCDCCVANHHQRN